jgi:hypothetical protein
MSSDHKTDPVAAEQEGAEAIGDFLDGFGDDPAPAATKEPVKDTEESKPKEEEKDVKEDIKDSVKTE